MMNDNDLPPLQNQFARQANINSVERPACKCMRLPQKNERWQELTIHQEVQDETSPGWIRLLELVDEAAADGREVFEPLTNMPPEYSIQIVTLPPSISKLKQVKRLVLYGSSLVRIPPEIGDMTSLEDFSPYTSYRLHWFPYEIRRCKNLRSSVVSTRAIYGNYKFRPPFPALPQHSMLLRPKTCSKCDREFSEAPLQRWTSRRMGSDIVPLLIHACSDECLDSIKDAPDGYVKRPHRGGLGLQQPPPLR